MAPLLTMGQLEDIQASCLADDIPIDFNRMSLWDESTARAYFESGGSETAVAAAADASGVAPSDAVAAGTGPPSRAFRWAVDISMWDPTPAQWTLLLGVLTEEVDTASRAGPPAANPVPVTVVCWRLVRRREPRRCASSFVRTRSERSSAGARPLTPQPTRTLALSAGGARAH